jgi:hypothetical protein
VVCRIRHQFGPQLEIVSFKDGNEAAREAFDEIDPIRSNVLPAFDLPLGTILADYPPSIERLRPLRRA